MENFKTTLIALAILILLGIIFILFFPLKIKNLEKEQKKLIILQLDPEKIQSITLNREKDSFTLSKIENFPNKPEWFITQPVKVEPNFNEVKFLLDIFSKLKAIRLATQHSNNLSSFGLDQPKISVIIMEQNTPKELLFGNPLAGGSEYYVKLKGHPNIFVVHENLFFRLNQKIKFFRNRKIFSYDSSQIIKLEIENRKYQWLANKTSDEQWKILFKKNEYSALKEPIMAIIKGMENLHVDEFTVDFINSEDIKNYHLDKPQIKFKVKSENGQEHALFISKKMWHSSQRGWVYIMEPKGQFIFGLESRFIEQLKENPKKFINKT